MANSNLQRMLEIAKRTSGKQQSSSAQPNRTHRPTMSARQLDEQVKQLDEQVYGKYVPPQQGEDKPYDPEEEMQSLQEAYNSGTIEKKLSESKLPQGILESFRENPLTVDPSMYRDSKMDAFAERIRGKMGVKNESKAATVSGLEAARGIQQKLLTEDVSRVAETRASTSEVVDYGLIRTIVEGVMEEKMQQMRKQMLTESASAVGSSLKAFTVRGDKFLFLTDDDSVYECEMKYKGKNRKRK